MKQKRIAAICKRYNIKNWSLEDGLVNVDGDVDLYNKGLTEFPLQFGKVEGNFNCSINNLTSLKGAPYYVSGYFNCTANSLTSLDYLPKYTALISITTNELYKVIDMPVDFFIAHNPVYYLYKYITIIDERYRSMTLKVDIDYFNDCKIQIEKDIHIDRFKAFLEEYGLNSNINIKELEKAGYNIRYEL